MAKSSYAVAVLLAGWGADAAAQAPADADPATADAAMKRYQEWVSGSVRACPASGPLSDEEIVVCGRTHRQPERSPLPVQREPGEIVRHINEPDGTTGALGAGRCSRLCEQPVQVNVFQVIFAAPKVIRHILHGDD
jgi:hypothetical protein